MKLNTLNELVSNIGNTKRERVKRELIREINQKEKNTLSHKWVKINDIETQLNIVSGTMANKKNISSMPGEQFNIGDIVEYSDSKWLILKADVDEEIYVRGQMQQCNYRLRWQEDDTRNIVEFDCIIESASQYNSGEESYKTITVGYNQYLIYIPLNENTIKFKSNDRFFIDNNKINPKVYRATRIDTVSFVYDGVGCICLLVTEDQYNPDTDNIEMFVCDYVEPDQNTDAIEISYKGQKNIICGGITKTFSVDESVMWEVEILPEYERFITIQTTDNTCKIKCANNLELIGKTIKIKCSNQQGNSGQLFVDIVSGI